MTNYDNRQDLAVATTMLPENNSDLDEIYSPTKHQQRRYHWNRTACEAPPTDAAAPPPNTNTTTTAVMAEDDVTPCVTPGVEDVLITTGINSKNNNSKETTTTLTILQKNWPGNVQFFSWILEQLVAGDHRLDPEARPAEYLAEQLHAMGGRFLLPLVDSPADAAATNKSMDTSSCGTKTQLLQQTASQWTWQVATPCQALRFCHEQVSVRRGAAARKKKAATATSTAKCLAKQQQQQQTSSVENNNNNATADDDEDGDVWASFYCTPMFSIGFNRPSKKKRQQLAAAARAATPSPDPLQQQAGCDDAMMDVVSDETTTRKRSAATANLGDDGPAVIAQDDDDHLFAMDQDDANECGEQQQQQQQPENRQKKRRKSEKAAGETKKSKKVSTNDSSKASSRAKDPKKESCRAPSMRWSRQEDEILKRAVQKEAGPPHNWAKIAETYFPGTRKALQCKTRWKNALSPEVNRAPFTSEEDKLIIAYHQDGYSWPDIVPHMSGRTAEQIRERFVNNIDPNLRTGPWTDEEDQILTDAQKELGNKWMEIKKNYLPCRSEMMIKNRWHNRKTKQRRSQLREMRQASIQAEQHEYLTKICKMSQEKPAEKKSKKKKKSAGGSRAAKKSAPPPLESQPNAKKSSSDDGNNSGNENMYKKDTVERFKRWTPQEDDLLRMAIAKEAGPPHNWKKISIDYFGGKRIALQCKTRWKNALDPDVNRGPFTAEEDKLIIELHKQGLSWPDIVPRLKGRTSEQIRERFVNNIDPNINLGPWTEEEDRILTEAQQRLGNRWMEVRKLLPGRSEKAIKNRWHNRRTKRRRALKRMAENGNSQEVEELVQSMVSVQEF